MSAIESAFLDAGRLDQLARQETWHHRLDPRAKLLTTLVFLVCVVSHGKYQLSALLPFALYPLVLAGAGQIPLGFVGRRMLLVAPFALMVGIVNPFLDRDVVLTLGDLPVSGGWLSFTSILARVGLTAAAVIVTIAITSFDGLCAALARFGVPQVLTVQLLLLYRYLFVLGDEALRMARARNLRSNGRRGLGPRVFANLIGHLLLRTLARARRTHQAMLCRGFTGEVRISQRLRLGLPELLFVVCWCTVFVLARTWNLAALFGSLLTGSP